MADSWIELHDQAHALVRDGRVVALAYAQKRRAGRRPLGTGVGRR
jgi:hypothetical protein